MFLDANFIVYLNLGEQRVWAFYRELVDKYALCTDPLVLDETIYVSKKKYGVKYGDTVDFLREIILPYVRVLPVGFEELVGALGFVGELDPSDALHIAVMSRNNESTIVSEDERFDKLGTIRRVWV